MEGNLRGPTSLAHIAGCSANAFLKNVELAISTLGDCAQRLRQFGCQCVALRVCHENVPANSEKSRQSVIGQMSQELAEDRIPCTCCGMQLPSIACCGAENGLP
jgi:hypothetical protein